MNHITRNAAPVARRTWPHALGMAAVVSALWAISVAHAEPSSREREALRRAQQSLRAVQEEREAIVGEKAALATEKTKLEDELKQVATKVRGAESQAAGLKARVAKLEASLTEQQKAVADGQARELALAEQLKQTEAKLAEQVRVVATVQALLTERTREAQTLIVQNQAMYKAGLDAIELYRAQSPSAFLLARDKLLGWENVKVENVAETLRDRMDDARYKPLPAEATAAGRVN